jgi:glycosyltransferase involved in cell wall biosynthesis
MGITLSEVGGSQKVVYSIISNLPEDLYDITLVTSPGGELLDWIKELNRGRSNKIRIVTLECIRRDISLFYDLATFFKLISIMKNGRYDVAHFHNSKMGTLGRIAAKLCGIQKIYYTMHGLNLNKKTTGRLYPVLSLIEKRIARFTTKVVFVSKHDMMAGIQNGWATATNACLIYNGIPEVPSSERRKKHLEDHDAPVIAFIARLAEPKQPEFAIRVSAKLLRGGNDHKLLIIGDGPKRTECEELIRSLGEENRIIMMGKCDNVMELLSQSDIFCLFSKSEGLPISIIEAMQCGLPVVASDIGGIPELIEHGVTGFLVPGQDEDFAAECLQKLFSDKEQRKNMGSQARKDANIEYSLVKMALEYKQIYEE